MTEDDDILAAEHALGLADAQAREDGDAEFASAVDRWRARFAPLLNADRTPPADLWNRVLARLPANDDTRADPARPWRFATFAASGLAAMLLGVIALRPDAQAPVPAPVAVPVPPAPARMMVAALTPKDGAGSVAITYDDRDGRLTVTPVGMDAGGRTPELWVIPADGTPRSLGVIADRQARTMLVAADRRAMIARGVTFAVSLEPGGGSPTGLPTGPVVMTGTMDLV